MKLPLDDAKVALESIIPYLQKNVFHGIDNWAVVGGFVRDSIISNVSRGKISSPDIDVAIIGHLPTLVINKEILDISLNTFGGMKINTRRYGIVDIWKIKGSKNVDPNTQWTRYLNEIDFSINSALYAIPEHKFYIHKEFSKALIDKKVSRLSSKSPKKHLQNIRAFALAQGLSLKTGDTYDVSDPLLRELNKISKLKKRKALKYANKKVFEKRWPASVVSKLTSIMN